MMSEKEFTDALSEAAENAIKGLQALGQLVYELVTDICDVIDKVIDDVISSIKKQDVKYDKNISHFKYISDRKYDNPYYRIEPKARSNCR